MKFLKPLYSSSRHCYKFLKHHQNPSFLSRNPSSHFPIFSNIPKIDSNLNFPLPISFPHSNFSACAELASKDDTFEDQSDVIPVNSDEKVEKKQKKKKLGNVKRNGGKELDEIIEIISGKVEKNESSDMKLKKNDVQLKEIEELKKKIKKLEKEVRRLKGETQNAKAAKKKEKESVEGEEHTTDKPKLSSLYAVFTSNSSSLSSVNVVSGKKKFKKMHVVSGKKKLKRTDVVSGDEKVKKEQKIMKELSPEMIKLVNRLHEDGYLSKLKIAPSDEIDLIQFNMHYQRNVLRSMAEKFGQDHQQIAKWLSGSNLKTVVLSGCPNLEKNTIFAAKRLRNFFKIQEDVVCRGCQMKSSCKFANKKSWPQEDELKLTDAMRVLTSYSLESVPEIPISSEVKNSISKLLTEAVNLSK